MLLPFIAFIIVSSEIIMYKNPISEIQDNWGAKEIIILLMVIGDSIATLVLIFRKSKRGYQIIM